jgi:hypothetical protein
VVFVFCQIQGAQRGIEVEVEGLRLASLRITQPCKLLCVSKNKFSLPAIMPR